MKTATCNYCGRNAQNEESKSWDDWCSKCRRGRIDVKPMTNQQLTPTQRVEQVWTEYQSMEARACEMRQVALEIAAELERVQKDCRKLEAESLQ